MPQPPNLQKMLRQAQEMMAAQQQAQDDAQVRARRGTAGGGMVEGR